MSLSLYFAFSVPLPFQELADRASEIFGFDWVEYPANPGRRACSRRVFGHHIDLREAGDPSAIGEDFQLSAEDIAGSTVNVSQPNLLAIAVFSLLSELAEDEIFVRGKLLDSSWDRTSDEILSVPGPTLGTFELQIGAERRALEFRELVDSLTALKAPAPG